MVQITRLRRKRGGGLSPPLSTKDHVYWPGKRLLSRSTAELIERPRESRCAGGFSVSTPMVRSARRLQRGPPEGMCVFAQLVDVVGHGGDVASHHRGTGSESSGDHCRACGATGPANTYSTRARPAGRWSRSLSGTIPCVLCLTCFHHCDRRSRGALPDHRARSINALAVWRPRRAAGELGQPVAHDSFCAAIPAGNGQPARR